MIKFMGFCDNGKKMRKVWVMPSHIVCLVALAPSADGTPRTDVQLIKFCFKTDLSLEKIEEMIDAYHLGQLPKVPFQEEGMMEEFLESKRKTKDNEIEALEARQKDLEVRHLEAVARVAYSDAAVGIIAGSTSLKDKDEVKRDAEQETKRRYFEAVEEVKDEDIF